MKKTLKQSKLFVENEGMKTVNWKLNDLGNSSLSMSRERIMNIITVQKYAVKNDRILT